MRKVIITLALALFSWCGVQAQVNLLRDNNFTFTGVSNEGLGVGYQDLARPYHLWNPKTDELKEIGGISSGDNHGGMARFSADGKYICGSYITKMDWSEDWTEYPQYEADYTINAIGVSDGVTLFAVGQDGENPEKGVLLKSSDGMSWLPVTAGNMPSTDGALNDIAFLTDYAGLIGGDGGYFAYTINKGATWAKMDPRPEGCTDEVDAYRTIDAIRTEPYVCVVGARLKDGGYAVYQSPDGAETWQATEGVLGVPVHISHSGFSFWMVTENGYIQKSIDLGLHWTEVAKMDEPLHKIYFSEEKTGIALSDGILFKTSDGGKNWDRISAGTGTSDVVWNDLLWTSNVAGILVGSDGACYSTEERGSQWQKMDIDTDKDLRTLAFTENFMLIGGVNGNLYRKMTVIPEVSMMGRYDVAADEWQPLGTFGYASIAVAGSSAGSAYSISGDGKVIVGTTKVYNPASTKTKQFAHATAWEEGTGLIDLGGFYDNIGRMTRANGVNYDGSVVVGCQDQNGPWFAGVWRRGVDGTYKQEYILKDPSLGTVETNRAGYAYCVSQDGKWIGGQGNNKLMTATDSPWIWSEETGLVELTPGYSGNVSAIRNDGTAFGWTGTGNGAFIYTQKDGYMDFNDYVKETLKVDLGDLYLYSILGMSPNGRYVCGWGAEPNKENPNKIDVVGFIADLVDPSIVEDVSQTQCNAEIYPNPAYGELHVDLPYSDVDTQIRLLDMQGRVVLNYTTATIQNTLSLNGVTPGLYILDITADGTHKSFKVEVAR